MRVSITDYIHYHLTEPWTLTPRVPRGRFVPRQILILSYPGFRVITCKRVITRSPKQSPCRLLASKGQTHKNFPIFILAKKDGMHLRIALAYHKSSQHPCAHTAKSLVRENPSTLGNVFCRYRNNQNVSYNALPWLVSERKLGCHTRSL